MEKLTVNKESIKRLNEQIEEKKAQDREAILLSICNNTATFIQSPMEIDKDPYLCPSCECEMEYSRVYAPGINRWIYRRERCQCEQEEVDQKTQEEEECQRRINVAYCREHSNLPGKLARLTFANFEERKGTKTAVDAAQAFVAQWSKDISQGLLLSGPNGCGKTHMVAAIANALIENAIRVEFYTGFDLLDRIRRTYDSHEETESDICDKLARVSLLIYDDLGNERIASDERGDWAREKLFRIFYWRDVYEKPMIVTTNYGADILAGKIGTATMSRLFGICGKPVLITASDYRLKAAA